ncbi:RDD family protein [Ignatzschineria sp. RMDPL8A]|uniref:RDD family protein n=1 Tax=Ignatzschineria sp. RMDPL8A TaxID=2999236 RepID=UPI0016AEC670|nr:RDD family protein [Ignatzschineria sp. RMDPL8A]MDG9729670.1 RDD family protein [Ignatzschineria sp. RMDPL8A]NLD08553.1 RDD family protein [Xanthomonadaceae bacterium]
MSKKYQVQFSGKLSDGISEAEAIRRVAAAYEVDEAEIEKWFTGEAITLREEANEAEKEEIVEFLSYFGLVLEVIELDGATDKAADETVDDAADEKPEEDEPEEESIWTRPRNENRESDENLPPEAADFKRDLQSAEEALADSLNALKEAIEKNPNAMIFRPAPLHKRFFAYVIDMFMVGIIFSFLLSYVFIPLGFMSEETIQLITNIYFEEARPSDEEIQEALGAIYYTVIPLMMAVYCGYFIILEGVMRGNNSLGKQFLNIRIYSVASPVPTLYQITLRTVTLAVVMMVLQGLLDSMIPMLGSLLFLASLGMARFDKSGLSQTFYDRIAGTCVGER